MQELLRNIGHSLQALLTTASMVQIVAVAIAILLSWWFGRQVRNTERARSTLIQSGLQARLTEALLISSPHIAALVLISAFGGVLHALKTDSHLVDLSITLAGLMLIIRVVVYLVRLSLGNRTKGWGNTAPNRARYPRLRGRRRSCPLPSWVDSITPIVGPRERAEERGMESEEMNW